MFAVPEWGFADEADSSATKPNKPKKKKKKADYLVNPMLAKISKAADAAANSPGFTQPLVESDDDGGGGEKRHKKKRSKKKKKKKPNGDESSSCLSQTASSSSLGSLLRKYVRGEFLLGLITTRTNLPSFS